MVNLFFQMIVNYLTMLWPAALGFGICMFWMRGYFNAYVKVRLSRGKLILLKLRDVDKTHYKVSEILGGNLIWGKEGNAKNPKGIAFNVDREYIYREMNVDCIDLDAKTFSFLPPNLSSKNIQVIKLIQQDKTLSDENKMELYGQIYSAIEGFSQENVDSLVVAAKYKPSLLDNKMKLIVICCIALFVGLIVIGFFLYNNNKSINGLYGDIQTIKSGVELLRLASGPVAT